MKDILKNTHDNLLKIANSLIDIENDIDLVSTIFKNKIQGEGRIFFITAGISIDLFNAFKNEVNQNYHVPKKKILVLLNRSRNYIWENQITENLDELSSSSIIEMQDRKFTKDDVLVAFSYSGLTDFVNTGVEYANKIGAEVVYILNNENKDMEKYCTHVIKLQNIDERVIGLGGTLPATYQKIVIDIILHFTLEKLGRIYKGNLISVQAKTKKMFFESIVILSNEFGLTYSEAEELLVKNNKSLPAAFISKSKNINYEESLKLLEENNWNIEKILS